MKILSDLVISKLQENYQTSVTGRVYPFEELPLPAFFHEGDPTSGGRFYITRSDDLPDVCHDACLFIALGAPAGDKCRPDGTVIYISDDGADLYGVMNDVLDFYEKCTAWHDSMERLIATGGVLEDYVAKSLPLFREPISITDYALRLLVYSDTSEATGVPEIKDISGNEPIPLQYLSTGATDDDPEFSSFRLLMTPFYVDREKRGSKPSGRTYCVNIFIADAYAGTCTMEDSLHPILKSDEILFSEFSKYIQRALVSEGSGIYGRILSMKNVFSDLLDSYLVSEQKLDEASQLFLHDMRQRHITQKSWQCFTVKRIGSHHVLPAEYITSAMENLLPYTCVVTHGDAIAGLAAIPEGADPSDSYQSRLMLILEDLDLKAGNSVPFRDIFDAKKYYDQACAILDTGYETDSTRRIYDLDGTVLDYMLQKCTGEFGMDMVFSEGLTELIHLDSGIDYIRTLREYLNNECHPTQTAENLFIHRTTLLARIEKIRKHVSLDTPEDRLYLRICLALLEREMGI